MKQITTRTQWISSSNEPDLSLETGEAGFRRMENK